MVGGLFSKTFRAESRGLIIIIIIILFIERHIQQAVRGALQHSIAALSVIINISLQVNYFKR